DLEDLEALRDFATRLIGVLAAFPAQATWAQWIEPLTELAVKALRQPQRVLSLLAELAPMGPVGPIAIAEVRLVLGRRLTELALPWPRIDLQQGRARVPSFYGLEVLKAAEGVLPAFSELSRRAEQAGGARLGWPAPREPGQAIDEAEYDLALLASNKEKGAAN